MEMRPSIKYVSSNGERGVKVKAYIYCFMMSFYCLKTCKGRGSYVLYGPNVSNTQIVILKAIFGYKNEVQPAGLRTM